MTTASMLPWKECRRHARAMLACLAMAAVLVAAGSGSAHAWGTDSAEMAERIAALLDLKPGATIAEIGAGHGYMAVRLAEKVGPTGHVFATEVVDDQLSALQDASPMQSMHRDSVALGGPQTASVEYHRLSQSNRRRRLKWK